jgi:hypothetical protein
MKLLLSMTLIVILAGCVSSEDDEYTSEEFSQPCLNGVSYYLKKLSHKGIFSVQMNIDSKVKTCIESVDSDLDERDFSILCLNNVEYYIRKISHKAFMAIKYNQNTKVSTCQIEK